MNRPFILNLFLIFYTMAVFVAMFGLYQMDSHFIKNSNHSWPLFILMNVCFLTAIVAILFSIYGIAMAKPNAWHRLMRNPGLRIFLRREDVRGYFFGEDKSKWPQN